MSINLKYFPTKRGEKGERDAKSGQEPGTRLEGGVDV